MTPKEQQGFTIIEVMLFVALTGALLIGLLAGTTIMIQRQRYTDSVNATQAFFQEQYGEVLNVVNARAGQEICDTANNQVQPASGNGEQPGTSRCVILGRAIDVPTASDNRTEITSYTIVGSAPTDSVDPDITEDELLALYRPNLVRIVGSETFQVPWNAEILGVRQNGGDQHAVNRLLLLRSPRSGATYTYSYNATSLGTAVGEGISLANRQHPVDVCVRSADLIASVSIVSIAMRGGPEAVSTAFDIDNAAGRCGS